MIALLAAATAALALLSPGAVLARYDAALAALREPRVFTFDYVLEQSGTRNLEQRHRVFRSDGNERDETISVNGTLLPTPTIRIFRGRPYRYTVARLSPRTSAYAFRYVGSRRDGHHVDYVFRLAPKRARPAAAFTEVAIDGLTFLPASVTFATGPHQGRGTVTFVKAAKWWVASGASATAREPGGLAHERIAFARWRFPTALPPSTFTPPRPLRSPAALP